MNFKNTPLPFTQSKPTAISKCTSLQLTRKVPPLNHAYLDGLRNAFSPVSPYSALRRNRSHILSASLVVRTPGQVNFGTFGIVRILISFAIAVARFLTGTTYARKDGFWLMVSKGSATLLDPVLLSRAYWYWKSTIESSRSHNSGPEAKSRMPVTSQLPPVLSCSGSPL